jgi:hypothetical protein
MVKNNEFECVNSNIKVRNEQIIQFTVNGELQKGSRIINSISAHYFQRLLSLSLSLFSVGNQYPINMKLNEYIRNVLHLRG